MPDIAESIFSNGACTRNGGHGTVGMALDVLSNAE